MDKQMYKLEIYAKKVYPICAIYKEGDKMIFIEPALIPQDTDAICFSAMANFLPFYRALCRGLPPEKMNLRVEEGEAIIECHDPCGLYPQYPSDGGSVVFAVRRSRVTEEDRKKVFRVPYTLEEIKQVHEERIKKYQETHK